MRWMFSSSLFADDGGVSDLGSVASGASVEYPFDSRTNMFPHCFLSCVHRWRMYKPPSTAITLKITEIPKNILRGSVFVLSFPASCTIFELLALFPLTALCVTVGDKAVAVVVAVVVVALVVSGSVVGAAVVVSGSVAFVVVVVVVVGGGRCDGFVSSEITGCLSLWSSQTRS